MAFKGKCGRCGLKGHRERDCASPDRRHKNKKRGGKSNSNPQAVKASHSAARIDKSERYQKAADLSSKSTSSDSQPRPSSKFQLSDSSKRILAAVGTGMIRAGLRKYMGSTVVGDKIIDFVLPENAPAAVGSLGGFGGGFFAGAGKALGAAGSVAGVAMKGAGAARKGTGFGAGLLVKGASKLPGVAVSALAHASKMRRGAPRGDIESGPIFYLQKVKVSVYNKWALRGVFLVGLLATACAVAKCFELPKLRTTTDPTYDGVHLTIWVRAELNAGLIAASIPPLKSLFEEVLRRVFHIKSGLQPSSGTPAYGAYGGGSRAYGMHSFKQGGHSRHRTLTDLDDDDDDVVGRKNGHATYIVGGKGAASAGRKGDADSEQEGIEEDQKHILQARSRERNGSGSIDLDEDHHGGNGGSSGRGGDAWIVKTVDYTVSESMSMKGQAR